MPYNIRLRYFAARENRDFVGKLNESEDIICFTNKERRRRLYPRALIDNFSQSNLFDILELYVIGKYTKGEVEEAGKFKEGEN